MPYSKKTNWTMNDPVTEVDINRWEQGIADAHQIAESVEAGTAESLRNMRINQVALAIELETIKNANLHGVDAGIVIETFRNLDDVTLIHGAFDSVNQKIYLP